MIQFKVSLKTGLSAQKDQLKDWKKLLKRKVYLDLEKFAIDSNVGITDGQYITRGDGLTNYVMNYTNNKKNKI